MSPFTTILGLFIFIALGVFTKKFFGRYWLVDTSVHLLSKIIYYVILPIVFIDTFAKRGIELADLNILIVAMIYIVFSVITLSIIPIRKDSAIKKAILLMSTFQNCTFLGFPLVYLIYGDISAAAMYSLIIAIMHITVAGILAGGKGNIVYSIAKIPVLYGFMIGTFVHYFLNKYYLSISYIISPFHIILSYGAVYVLGYTLPLTLSHVKEYVEALYITSLWRLGVSPLVHYIVLLFIPMPILYYKEIMVLSFLPPAVMNTVIARIYGWKPEVVASVTMILTLITLAIVPILIFIG